MSPSQDSHLLYDISLFSTDFAPSCTAQHPYYQRCWTPVPSRYNSSKANGSLLAFFLVVFCGLAGFMGACADFADGPT
jgi:hypothetical protein